MDRMERDNLVAETTAMIMSYEDEIKVYADNKKKRVEPREPWPGLHRLIADLKALREQYKVEETG